MDDSYSDSLATSLRNVSGVTVGHTWTILVFFLVALWVLGFSFRSVRV